MSELSADSVAAGVKVAVSDGLLHGEEVPQAFASPKLAGSLLKSLSPKTAGQWGQTLTIDTWNGVFVSVEGFTGAPSALLGNPQLVRPGIYYVEYTLSPAAWYMEVYKKVPFSLRFPEVTVRVNSDWGRVVLSGNEPALFVLPYDRH